MLLMQFIIGRTLVVTIATKVIYNSKWLLGWSSKQDNKQIFSRGWGGGLWLLSGGPWPKIESNHIKPRDFLWVWKICFVSQSILVCLVVYDWFVSPRVKIQAYHSDSQKVQWLSSFRIWIYWFHHFWSEWFIIIQHTLRIHPSLMEAQFSTLRKFDPQVPRGTLKTDMQLATPWRILRDLRDLFAKCPANWTNFQRSWEVETEPIKILVSGCHKTKSGWWFQIFFIFTPTWLNDPIWLACFSGGLVQPPTRNYTTPFYIVCFQLIPRISHQ